MRDGKVNLCTENPEADIDLYIRSSLRTMVEVEEGNISLKAVISEQRIKAQGNKKLESTMLKWLGINPYANVRSGDPAFKTISADE